MDWIVRRSEYASTSKRPGVLDETGQRNVRAAARMRSRHYWPLDPVFNNKDCKARANTALAE
jgi:hypothetical protein